jgi:hypothetical protein
MSKRRRRRRKRSSSSNSLCACVTGKVREAEYFVVISVQINGVEEIPFLDFASGVLGLAEIE